MAPSPQAGFLVGIIALAALLLPPAAVGLVVVAVLGVVIADARSVRAVNSVTREIPAILSRGVASELFVAARSAGAREVLIHQPVPPWLGVVPSTGDGELRARLIPARRGRYTLEPVAVRTEGPLGLGRWFHRAGGRQEVLVFPDLPAARRIALAVRQGRFTEPGYGSRGPLGLGTEFESIRDYLPDDDIRQVNWTATARVGRPMSNQFRLDQDRDVLCLVDAGRLMTAPLRSGTRLDAALDAVTAVVLVADEMGDRSGAFAFDSEVRREIRPKRAGANAVVRGLFDLEPRSVDSDFELAFRSVGGKRAFVLVLTDLLDESAAKSLLEAVPVLVRRHAVVVASATDPEVDDIIGDEPDEPFDVYRLSVSLETLRARDAVVERLRRVGAGVITVAPDRLGAACVASYLRAKTRSRL